jgi:hypothetical protein
MTEQNYRIRIKLGEVEIEAEGDKEFVEKAINDRKNLFEKTPPAPIITSKGEVAPKNEITSGTLKQFYQEKSPSGHHENIAVFAYYLKSAERKEEFTKDDINSCYTKAMVRKPKRIQTAIADTAHKYQFVEKGSQRGSWKLTSHGENLVLHDLPRKKE